MLDACTVITALMKRPENNFQFTVGRWKLNLSSLLSFKIFLPRVLLSKSVLFVVVTSRGKLLIDSVCVLLFSVILLSDSYSLFDTGFINHLFSLIIVYKKLNKSFKWLNLLQCVEVIY